MTRIEDNQPIPAHPIVFLFLVMPFGIMNGFLTVTVAYLLSNAGVSTEDIGGLIAISFIPHTWKPLWAPIVDTTLKRKTWYVLACLISAVGIAATGAIPAEAASMQLLIVIILISNVAITFLAMSVESLIAYNTPEDKKGRAAGWFQAGNLGGSGIGGGAGLWIASHFDQSWLPGSILGAVCVLCCIGLFFVDEPAATHQVHGAIRNVINVVKDLWDVLRARRGYLALLICFLPLGTGAASNLWSAVAGDWSASADSVSLVNGVMGGLISALGCMIGGFICDRMDRKNAYALFGAIMAACAVAMALAPRTQTMYVWFVLIYSFINGLAYAAFTAVTLEAIGKGAAATKYTLYSALSNTPIAYMTLIDGWARTHWDTSAMLYTEAAFAVVGIVVFYSVVKLSGRARSGDALTV
jgi:MFS transporter, PAT family, beta-lactamase induction signal transducer AmpG